MGIANLLLSEAMKKKWVIYQDSNSLPYRTLLELDAKMFGSFAVKDNYIYDINTMTSYHLESTDFAIALVPDNEKDLDANGIKLFCLDKQRIEVYTLQKDIMRTEEFTFYETPTIQTRFYDKPTVAYMRQMLKENLSQSVGNCMTQKWVIPRLFIGFRYYLYTSGKIAKASMVDTGSRIGFEEMDLRYDQYNPKTPYEAHLRYIESKEYLKYLNEFPYQNQADYGTR